MNVKGQLKWVTIIDLFSSVMYFIKKKNSLADCHCISFFKGGTESLQLL